MSEVEEKKVHWATKKRLEKEALEADPERAKLEAEALERVCKALNVDPNRVVEEEKKQAENPNVTVFASKEGVCINGRKFRGYVNVPLDLARVIAQAVGDRTERHIKEMIGHDYRLGEIRGDRSSSQHVTMYDQHGNEVSS